MYLFFRLSKMINCFPGSFSSFDDDEIDEEEDD